jgi:GAF domain-containing protein/anti-sigma regulatory factor (Ser/Thr protein kinase)
MRAERASFVFGGSELAAMTEFGFARLQTILRVRLALVACAFALAFVIQLRYGIYPSWFLVALLALDLMATFLSAGWLRRWGAILTLRVFLALDTLVVGAAVLSNGGIAGGLTALYALTPFLALLLLGRRDAIRFAVASGIIFLLQAIWDLGEIRAQPPSLSLVLAIVEQSAILALFFAMMSVYVVVTLGATRRLYQDKILAEVERSLAEQAQKRWALVNDIALRIQECATPEQIDLTVGEELERRGLHCAMLEWAERDVAMRVRYVSLPTESLRAALESLKIDLETFQIPLTDKLDLTKAIATRTPLWVKNVVDTAAPLFEATPKKTLEKLTEQFEMQSFVLAPMVYGDTVNGVLAVFANTLEETAVTAFAALANQTASALEKERLLAEQRKRAAQLEIVGNLSAQMSGADSFRSALQTIVNQVQRAFGYHNVAVFEIDAKQNRAILLVASGLLADRIGLNYTQSLERGIIGLVARTGELYLARNTQLDANYWTLVDGADPVHSELTIPLKQGDGVIGILDVQSTQENAFDPSDVTALSLLAEQIGNAFGKANALAAEQKRALHLAWVSQVAARATASAEPETIIRTLVELVQQRFEYHHVCYSSYDAAKQEMELQAVAGDDAALYTPGERWSAVTGLIGLAARTGRTVVSGDVRHDSRYFSKQASVGGANSELCVPLLGSRRVLGVLDVESLKMNAFDTNDIGAMETLCTQMAVALEQAYSLQTEQRRSAQMALVNRIASQTARLVPVEQLLRDAVVAVQTQFQYYHVAIFLNTEGQSGWRLVASAGGLESLADVPLPTMGQGIVPLVGRTGETYLSVDTHADAFYQSSFPAGTLDPVQSEIAIPLRRGQSVIGILDIQSERRNAFSPTDVTALEILADQLAAALENARLYEAEARRAAQLDAVRLLALKITAERDLNALLHSIITSAMDLVDADGATLDLMDEATGELVVFISRNLPQDYSGYRLRLNQGLAGRVAAQGEPLIVHDYATWEGRLPDFPTDMLAGMMAVPLKWRNRVLGVIGLHRRRGRLPFDQETLHLAALFAAQAAIAIENADLLEALQARLRAQRALTETSVRFLELTEPQAILDLATRTARAALDSKAAFSFLADEHGELALSSGAGPVPQAFGDLPAPLRNGLETAFKTRTYALWHSADSASATSSVALSQSEFSSGIVVPMQNGETVVGVIAVAGRVGRQYDATDAQSLALLANQTASALARADAFRQEQQRVQEMNLLFESFRATASTLEPQEVIRRLLEQLVRALDVTSGFFVRIDHARRELIQMHEYYTEAALPSERQMEERVWDFERSPALSNLLMQRLLVLQADDPTLSPELKAYMRSNQVHSILRVLVMAGEQALGYISLWETRAPRRWNVNETRFVQTMASQAAVALVNAELYQAAETRSRELQALHEAGRLISSSLDLRAICENSVNALCDILGYHHVGIYFVAQEHLELQFERGYEQVLDHIPLTRGVMGRAARTRQTIFLPDVAAEPGFLRALHNVQAEIAVPLLAGERVLGVLNVETVADEGGGARAGRLTPDDVQLLSTFANQLVVAIENARLFQELQQHLKEVRTLHAASQALNSELELEAVLERVAAQFVGALNVDSCTLTEWDRSREELVILVDLDPDLERQEAVGKAFPMVEPFVQTVLQDQVAIALRTDDPALDAVARRYLELYAWQSLLLVPLVGKGQVIGLVELGDRRSARSFSADELSLAQSLAVQAAIAIENAKLYRNAQQRLREMEILYRYASELGGTLDIKTLGARALEAVARLTDFDFGEVCLVREADHALVPLVQGGEVNRSPETAIAAAGVGIIGWAAEHGRTVRLGDVTRDPRYVAFSEHMMSEICVPLRVGERTIGVLNLEAKAPNAFDAHTEQLLTVFAHQLAIAIENARLYEQTKHDAEVKAVLLRELSHRVKNNLAAITSLLYMALDEQHETREQILSETLGRVQSMATAHTLLARASEGYVDLLDIGAQVLQDTMRHLALPGAQIQIQTQGDHVQIAMRQLTTLALVLNELATNSLRHGWDETANAPLVLRFVVTRQADQIAFSLQDNGKGLPAAFDLNQCAGLGLTLVHSLVEKDLHGLFSIRRRDGWTSAEVKFRLAKDNV